MIELRPGDGTIGYVLGRRWWNRGIMSEALRAVVRYAHETLGLTVLRAWCDDENTASARVLEKRMHARAHRAGAVRAARFGDHARRARLYVYETFRETDS